MPFPAAWPPRHPSGKKSLRFYTTGTSTADFEDNAFLWIDQAGANPYVPTPVVVGKDEKLPVDVSGGTGSGGPRGTGKNNPGDPAPMIWAANIRIVHGGQAGDLEISFDGTTVHGKVGAGEDFIYWDRFEAGIAIRGAGGTPTYRIEAW
jgi:hypothetical protein